MSKKVWLSVIAAVALGSTALVFAQFGGPQQGPGRGRPVPPGGAPAVQFSSVIDMDVAGNYFYILTGEWVHKIRISQVPNLVRSADLREPLLEASGGQGPVKVSNDAYLRVSDTGEVLVMTNGALIVLDVNLNRAQIRPLAPAMREAMETQQRARASRQRPQGR